MTKKKDIKMSKLETMEFNTSYSMPLDKSAHYWDTTRNQDKRYVSFEKKLDLELKSISDLLKSKNKAYGDTALNPTNIFSKLSATEAICARIDDKLARIGNKGINDKTEDTVDDLIGYLLLLKMSMEK